MFSFFLSTWLWIREKTWCYIKFNRGRKNMKNWKKRFKCGIILVFFWSKMWYNPLNVDKLFYLYSCFTRTIKCGETCGAPPLRWSTNASIYNVNNCIGICLPMENWEQKIGTKYKMVRPTSISESPRKFSVIKNC